MLSLSFDKYDHIEEKFSSVTTDETSVYGLTWDDIVTMNENPSNDMITYAIFLSTRPWYSDKSDKTEFFNKDALSKDRARAELNRFLNANLHLKE